MNISENDNSLDTNLVMQVAPYFKLTESNANNISQEMTAMVGKWYEVAKNLEISNKEREMMKPAYRS